MLHHWDLSWQWPNQDLSEEKKDEVKQDQVVLRKWKNLYERHKSLTLSPQSIILFRSSVNIGLCYAGIPSNLRGTFWPYLIGNDLRITTDLYGVLAEKVEEIRSKNGNTIEIEKDELANEMVESLATTCTSEQATFNLPAHTKVLSLSKREVFLEQISQDLPRTFPHLAFFHKGGPCEVQLRRVLESYALFRPNMGYIQGMSYIAAMLLLYLDEEDCFVALCNVFHSHEIFNTKEVMRKHCFICNDLLKYYVPKVHYHLSSLDILPEMYMLDWILTLFSNTLNLEVVARLWDCYFYFDKALDKQLFLWRTVIAIHILLQDKIIAVDSFSDALGLLRNIRDHVQEDELLKKVKTVTISPRLYRSLKNKYAIGVK
mmetsp:Transcript_5492/g.7250  ORF Transcript_5492/g.7250 Transcript_5492/m.7250 type:complete len:373 (-) Transcript_5492:1831-2949(-)